MKYIIDIDMDNSFEDDYGNLLYRAKGFNSLVFDNNGLKKLTPLDAKGEMTNLLKAAIELLDYKKEEDKYKKERADKLDSLIGIDNPNSELRKYVDTKTKKPYTKPEIIRKPLHEEDTYNKYKEKIKALEDLTETVEDLAKLQESIKEEQELDCSGFVKTMVDSKSALVSYDPETKSYYLKRED